MNDVHNTLVSASPMFLPSVKSDKDMNKFSETYNAKVSFYQAAIAGGAAGAFTRAVAQPLDVLKIRFQLQLEPIVKGANSKYVSIPQAVSTIVKEEGLSTLWSGHVPAQLLSITYGVVQFSTFEKMAGSIKESDPKFYLSNSYIVNFGCGALAAKFATLASFPFDTLRTRLIAEEKTKKAYKGFCNAIVTMVRTEGPFVLFKGLVPTLGQVAPHAGIQFAVYKMLTDNIFNRITFFQRRVSLGQTVESSLIANILAGAIAGVAAKTAIYPLDMVKKRLQIQGFQKHREVFGKQMYCTGLLDCLRLTITQEGFTALYKGYWPSMLKAVLVTALHFAVYDEIKHFLMTIQR